MNPGKDYPTGRPTDHLSCAKATSKHHQALQIEVPRASGFRTAITSLFVQSRRQNEVSEFVQSSSKGLTPFQFKAGPTGPVGNQ